MLKKDCEHRTGIRQIPWAKPSLGEAEKVYLADAIDSTWISGGPYLGRFETEFSRRIAASYGVAVSSGTVALKAAVGYTQLPVISRQKSDAVVKPAIWAMVIALDPKICRRSRDEVIKLLACDGIETRPGFYPFFDMSVCHAPISETASEVSVRIILMPTFADLTGEDIARVCESLKKAVN